MTDKIQVKCQLNIDFIFRYSQFSLFAAVIVYKATATNTELVNM